MFSFWYPILQYPWTSTIDMTSKQARVITTCFINLSCYWNNFLYSLKPAGRQASITISKSSVQSDTDQARQQAQQSLDQQIAAVKRQHEEELAKLRKTFDEELEKEKDSLRTEQDNKIATYKNELSAQLVIVFNIKFIICDCIYK